MLNVREVTRVVTGNVTLVAPAGTVTVAGTPNSLGTPADRFTIHPLEGAGFESVNVPVAVVPAATDVGLTEMVLNGQFVTEKFPLR